VKGKNKKSIEIIDVIVFDSMCDTHRCKAHQSNWNYEEIMFIQPKNNEYVSTLDIVDPKDRFGMATSKWNIIVKVINATRHSSLLHVKTNDVLFPMTSKEYSTTCPKHVITFSTSIWFFEKRLVLIFFTNMQEHVMKWLIFFWWSTYITSSLCLGHDGCW
jgi:hypothetical protein